MNCTQCNQGLKNGANFCGNCGKQVEAQQTAVQQQSFQTTPFPDIKCGQCGYSGPGEKARSTVAVVFAWIGIILSPLIPLIYFLVTHKWRCPQCKSTFIGVRNKYGVYESSRGDGWWVVFVILGIFVGIVIIGIMASVVLASLSGARERAQIAMFKQEANSVLSAFVTACDDGDTQLRASIPPNNEYIAWSRSTLTSDCTFEGEWKFEIVVHPANPTIKDECTAHIKDTGVEFEGDC